MEKEHIEAILLNFLEGKIALEEVLSSLKDYVKYNLSGPNKYITYYRDPKVEIQIYPGAINSMLTRYLEEEITAENLQQWASFILTTAYAIDGYSSPGGQDDEEIDRYEPMWYVLQQLSSPEIDGRLTPAKARNHLERLEKL